MRIKLVRQVDQNVNVSPIISSVVVHSFSAVAYIPESFITVQCLDLNRTHRIGTMGSDLVVCLYAVVQIRAWLVCLATKNTHQAVHSLEIPCLPSSRGSKAATTVLARRSVAAYQSIDTGAHVAAPWGNVFHGAFSDLGKESGPSNPERHTPYYVKNGVERHTEGP
jgi:hypothetical protein